MKTPQISLLLLCVTAWVGLSAQNNKSLLFKLQLLPDGNTWGVFVKPDSSISPSQNTVTGSGQITLVAPNGFTYSNQQSVSGSWVEDARVNAPVENPSKDYISFGLITDNPKIIYQAGVETLLFKIKKNGACPDSLYLIQNGVDLFDILPNSVNSNPGNGLSVVDFGVSPTQFYNYSSNYAPGAWSCQDNDGDSVAVGCLKMKLALLPNNKSWAVFVKPVNGFNPDGNAVTTSGKVTVKAPLGFPLTAITSHAGTWSLNSVVSGPPENPGMKYVTFELQPNSSAIPYASGQETMLFSFPKLGDCPDTLAIVEDNDPYPAPPNELTGTFFENSMNGAFGFCGVYAKKAWKCKSAPVIISTPYVTEDSLISPNPPTFVFRGNDSFEKPDTAGLKTKARWFTCWPNPATDRVFLSFEKKLPENEAVLRLWTAHGICLHRQIVNEHDGQLELDDMPSGLYWLTLETAVEILQREHFVKK